MCIFYYSCAIFIAYFGIVFGNNSIIKEGVIKDIFVKNLDIERCDGTDSDPLTVYNISAAVVNKKLSIGGSVILDKDISSPVKANIEIKRHVLVWIEIPCEKNVGSCTYADVCKFGIPKTKSCPPEFKENKVPCRCPVEKGNYSLPQDFEVSLPFNKIKKSLITGKYKGNVELWNSDSNRLACYNFNFILV